MVNNRSLGSKKEMEAAAYLKSRGIRIVSCNYRCAFGEIDIIGMDKDTYVFFEVKYRASDSKGYASDAVGYKKQRIISRVCDYYRMKNGLGDFTPCRFDVIAIDGGSFDWIKNAFYYIPGRK